MHIAIAATEFNYDITSMMLERAQEHARFLGADVTHIVRVPGVYDLPFAVKRLMKRDDVDGIVTLGCVIEGETDHDDLVIQHAARKIIDISLENDKPVGLGITGPGMSRLQAMARIDRAKEAVEAAVRLHRDLEPRCAERRERQLFLEDDLDAGCLHQPLEPFTGTAAAVQDTDRFAQLQGYGELMQSTDAPAYADAGIGR
jgi:6,7-dimethyl-8-ribityllumazine synthase